ncbi:MAG: sulfotransferase domain-containing protein [Bacteroidales bacterium]|nr:MAG: sulfotransferase domain-containing protein [Bacteroidales bacterium]
MDDPRKIVWLASYPKSGNTWFRVFLSNLLSKADQPADINNLFATPIASNRELFDEATGLSSSDLTPDEIDNLRPGVYEYASRNSNELLFQKVHDAWLTTELGEPMFSKEVTQSVVYFVRNPLDVAVSFANHLSKSLDETVKIMTDESYAFGSTPNRLHIQLRQRLLTWSNHVRSWVDQSDLPIIVLRYEDIKADTFTAFSKAVNFIGINASANDIVKAIGYSDIKEMQKQEAEKGFKEKPANALSFFRKGVAGSWRAELPDYLVTQICNDHREMMIRFGYLDDNGIRL